MGAAETKPEYDIAVETFTNQERIQIDKIFHDIACDSSAVSFSKDNFETYLAEFLPQHIIKCLHHEISNILLPEDSRTVNTHVSKQSFIVGLAFILKGSISERSEVFMSLATIHKTASSSELAQCLECLLESYLKLMVKTPQFSSWNLSYSKESVEKFTTFLIDSLVNTDDGNPKPNKDFDLSDLEKWLAKSAFVTHMMDYIFHACFNVSYIADMTAIDFHKPKVPYCFGANWELYSSLMDLTSLVFLNHSIPEILGQKWRMLYNTSHHGESFSTMVKYSRKQGPCIIIIKDKDEHVFGAFAADQLDTKPEWVGTTRCFLFTLAPSVSRYFPTGYNDHYQYLNQGQQTMPNGLGFGGQFEYFGLWIDSEFGVGHSKGTPKCTTYNSPQLSSKPEFQIAALELWGVGETALQSKEVTSVLDKDNTAKALLNIAGKQMHSEGLRSTDATAESPEEHSLPPL